mmetsp:Transcript_36080/g.93720  ORF Transcript_36080/g.93720 Transcript_36080/m.93720 type:complete len:84 (-) Transcript_36080:348-599(-)
MAGAVCIPAMHAETVCMPDGGASNGTGCIAKPGAVVALGCTSSDTSPVGNRSSTGGNSVSVAVVCAPVAEWVLAALIDTPSMP